MPAAPLLQLLGGTGGVGLAASVPAGTYDNNQISPTDAVCNISLQSTGACAVSSGTTPPPPNWKTGGGTGANYWARWTNTSGTLTVGTVGTWIQLSTSPTWGVSFTLNSVGTKNCIGTVDIATDSGGASIIATGSITLVASVDV